MMNSDELGKMLEGTVSECQAKMTLVNDYLDRFKIQDLRIVAPIRDIERCIDVMLHMLYGHGLDHDHLFLDTLNENRHQLSVLDSLETVAIFLDQLRQDLLDLLGDQSEVFSFPESSFGVLVCAPAEALALQQQDRAQGVLQRHDVPLEPKIGHFAHSGGREVAVDAQCALLEVPFDQGTRRRVAVDDQLILRIDVFAISTSLRPDEDVPTTRLVETPGPQTNRYILFAGRIGQESPRADRCVEPARGVGWQSERADAGVLYARGVELQRPCPDARVEDSSLVGEKGVRTHGGVSRSADVVEQGSRAHCGV